MNSTSLPLIRVGSLVVARRATAVCDVGEKGVCYEVYELGDRPGWSVIFERGRYDGFAPDEVALFLDVTGAVCDAVADYAFTNVNQLRLDFLSFPEDDANGSTKNQRLKGIFYRRGCK